MKILFMTADRSRLMGKRMHHWLEQEMALLAECKWAGVGHPGCRDESLDEAVTRLYPDDPPDWVIMAPWRHVEQWRWVDFRVHDDRRYKIAAHIADIHHNRVLGINHPPWFAHHINKVGFDAVLMRYLQVTGREIKPGRDPDVYVKTLEPLICHVPPHVSKDVYRPSDEVSYDAVFLGSVDKLKHKLRWDIYKGLERFGRGRGWRVLVGKPPSGPMVDLEEGWRARGFVVGDDYVRVLAGSRVMLFGSSKWRYMVRKYFEGMACRTLVMADTPRSADLVHFEPGWNFVEIDRGNWREKLEYYLTHEEERVEIAQRGYETYLKYHTSAIRARDLVAFLEENR